MDAGLTAAPSGARPQHQRHVLSTSASVAAVGESPAAAAEVVVVMGGDVSFARMRGQRLIGQPLRDDLVAFKALLAASDVRFVNLESPLVERHGRTHAAHNKLVFSAPPQAAAALSRAHIDIVSLANNHAWDYGRAGLLETMLWLSRAHIATVGAAREAGQAYAPTMVESNGMKIAFIAVTAVWNQSLSPHPGKRYIADARVEPMVAAISRARSLLGADKVIVSHHGGYEYVDRPHAGTRALLAAAVAAGADVVVGHHPHVVQRVAMVKGKPVFYSLGNMLMRMVNGHPWTEIGMLARVKLRRRGSSDVWICPFRMHGLDPIVLAHDARRRAYQHMIQSKLRRLQQQGAVEEPTTAARVGAFGADGCAPLTAP